VVYLWGRQWSRGELLARVGRVEQLGGVQLVEAADGAERGVRLLRFATGAGLGGTSVRIADTVTNIGATPCPHMMLYHCNVGFPVVDDGAELAYPAPPGTCVSEASTERYRQLAGPQPAFVEECYEHDMVPDAAGYVSAGVLNRAAGLGVYQRYRKDQLPHHVTWRQLGSGTFVVAMEPSTNRDAGRFDARERGELIHLGPGERRRYDLDLGVLSGSRAVAEFAARSRELVPEGTG